MWRHFKGIDGEPLTDPSLKSSDGQQGPANAFNINMQVDDVQQVSYLQCILQVCELEHKVWLQFRFSEVEVNLIVPIHLYLSDGMQEKLTSERFYERFRAAKKRVYMDPEVAAANLEKYLNGISHATLPGTDTPSLKYCGRRIVSVPTCLLPCLLLLLHWQSGHSIGQWTTKEYIKLSLSGWTSWNVTAPYWYACFALPLFGITIL